MGVRKNAKFLSATEKEAFVRACVLMKADIVNPGASAAQRYSRWDEYVAIHWMIQNAFAPGSPVMNFGHGGNGAYGFLSWHRYFLYQFEQVLQGYVAGVMLPYWDWTDPAPIMTDTFIGPNGTVSSEVRSGYFARDAPGTAGNVTPAPAWWPAGLTGWILPTAFGTGSGALRRGIATLAELPVAQDLRETLAKTTYPSFQNALESGSGLTNFPSQQMHNDIHGWLGGPVGQMRDPRVSAFDPFFYLHHCNIDRIWAMWQMDGHATEYPTSGPKPHHLRNDIMYPWTGGAAGYGTNVTIGTITMPNFAVVGEKRNVDTLDCRPAFRYTYDTLAVIGIGLDRTGSMNALTPDPMLTGAPDVTKWEAAKRGVSAFLQDCETVQNSGTTYVTAGIKTFRSLVGNEFSAVFAAPGYGLVKSGTSYSRATFDSAVAAMTPGGGTPLADALQDVRATLVDPPFGHLPAGERRYLAMLTDGLLTTGSPMSSIPDNSFGQTAVFAMGFGTGADVDYGTLASMVAKGLTLSTPQVFHGENAGTIDKFYSNALASAIGFTTVIDPVLELFAGEHAHIEFNATSADDAFLITAQGMDFDDGNWQFHLHGPLGLMAHGEAGMDMHMHMSGHVGCLPDVTVTRDSARLSLVLQRDNADYECWVGQWRLMVAYKARTLDAMVMPTIGELLVPVSAGPTRGKRFSRLLAPPNARLAVRNTRGKPAHRLDVQTVSTNRNDQQACNVVVNIYARTRLQLELVPRLEKLRLGEPISVAVQARVLQGNITTTRSFGRLLAPTQNLAALVSASARRKIPKEAALEGSKSLKFDPAMLLALLEKRTPKLGRLRDEELKLASQHGGLHLTIENTEIPGAYHLGVYVEGTYCPDHALAMGHDHHGGGGHVAEHDHDHAAADASTCDPDCILEPFIRLLTTTVGVPGPRGSRRRSGVKRKAPTKR